MPYEEDKLEVPTCSEQNEILHEDILELTTENYNLKQKLERELKDNNGLREYIGKYRVKLEKITNWYGRIQGEVSHESALEMVNILKDKE